MMNDLNEEKEDILFQIDMQLYNEFNEKFCEINDNLGIVYSYKDLEDLEKLEKDTEIKLLRKAIKELEKIMNGGIKMFEVTYSIDGILKKINVNAEDSIIAQNIFTNMFSGQKVEIINVRRI